MNCEQIDACTFFNDDMDSNAVKMLKDAYCQGNHEQCARYRVMKAVGYKYVPLTLYPNQTHLAPSIIKNALQSKGE